jgi:hypothetical protein
MYNLVDVHAEHILTPSDNRTRGNAAYRTLYTHADVYRYSFFVKNGMNVFTSAIALLGWWTLNLSGTGQWCWVDVELVVWCFRWCWYARRKNIDIHQHVYTVFCRLHYLWFCCSFFRKCAWNKIVFEWLKNYGKHSTVRLSPHLSHQRQFWSCTW